MKKIIFALLFAALSVAGCNAEASNADTQDEETITIVMSAGDPIMTVNGSESEIDPGYGTAPIIENGRTIVPVRAVVESMGGRVEWNSESQTISIYRGDDTVVLEINSETAYLNGEEYTLDTVPVIINSRTFVHLRFVSEGLGFDVEWNDGQITITTGNRGTTDDLTEEVTEEVENIAEDEVNYVSETDEQEDNMISINLKIGDNNFSAKLYDNDTTQKLIEKFPVTYSMSELHGNEKYYYMDESLPTDSETPSYINKGEIMLYGSDCLVVFYDTFSNVYSYTRLGYIEDTAGLEDALGSGSVAITFEME